jgi:hypothetical protein
MLKEASDEFELFLGKIGKNEFNGDNGIIDYYKNSKFKECMPDDLKELVSFIHQEELDNLNGTFVKQLLGVEK